jgi:hypothetical protein
MQRHLLSIFIGTTIALILGSRSGSQLALLPLMVLILGDSRDGFGLTDFVLLLGLYGGAITGVLIVFWFQLRKHLYVKRAVSQLGGLLLLQVWLISSVGTSNLYTTGVLVGAGLMAIASALLIATLHYRKRDGQA